MKKEKEEKGRLKAFLCLLPVTYAFRSPSLLAPPQYPNSQIFKAGQKKKQEYEGKDI